MNNEENIWINAWPLSSYYAAYIDFKKSLPHRNEQGIMENLPGFPFWIPEQRYLANVNDYIDAVSNIDYEEFIIEDPFLQKPLLKYRVEKGKSAIYDGVIGNGMLLLQYTEDLLGYTKRDDGLLGIQSLSLIIDTRLSLSEALKNPSKYQKRVPRTNTSAANFSNFGKIKEEHDKKMAKLLKEKQLEEEKAEKQRLKISKVPNK